MILVAVSAMRLRPMRLRVVATSLLLVWAALAGAGAQRQVYKAPGWDRLVAELVQREGPAAAGTPATIYTLAEDEGFPIRFYLDRLRNHDFRVVVVRKDDEANRKTFGEHGLKPYWADTLPVILVKDVRDLPGDSFWIADDGENGETLGYRNQSFRNILTSAGFTVEAGISAEFINRRWNRAAVHLLPVSRSPAANSTVAVAGTLVRPQEARR
jgi:hypothetical protein